MRTVSHQGAQLSASDRRSLAMRAAIRPAPSIVDYDQLRADLNARQFTGPATPIALRREFSDEAESARYWRLVEEFKRWGYCEHQSKGTPWMGDVFGYSSF